MAEGGLGHVQKVGGAAQTARFMDGLDRAQMTELDVHYAVFLMMTLRIMKLSHIVAFATRGQPRTGIVI